MTIKIHSRLFSLHHHFDHLLSFWSFKNYYYYSDLKVDGNDISCFTHRLGLEMEKQFNYLSQLNNFLTLTDEEWFFNEIRLLIIIRVSLDTPKLMFRNYGDFLENGTGWVRSFVDESCYTAC